MRGLKSPPLSTLALPLARVVHPLSCVVEAAAARQLCAVLEVRRALSQEEGLMDALLAAVCEMQLQQ